MTRKYLEINLLDVIDLYEESLQLYSWTEERTCVNVNVYCIYYTLYINVR